MLFPAPPSKYLKHKGIFTLYSSAASAASSTAVQFLVWVSAGEGVFSDLSCSSYVFLCHLVAFLSLKKYGLCIASSPLHSMVNTSVLKTPTVLSLTKLCISAYAGYIKNMWECDQVACLFLAAPDYWSDKRFYLLDQTWENTAWSCHHWSLFPLFKKKKKRGRMLYDCCTVTVFA